MKKNRIKIARITELQKQFGFWELQALINTGEVWHMEREMGIKAVQAMRMGACMLPKERSLDALGNIVPSRLELRPYSMGTLQRCQEFWEKYYVADLQLN